jgi:hypothetical protein
MSLPPTSRDSGFVQSPLWVLSLGSLDIHRFLDITKAENLP